MADAIETKYAHLENPGLRDFPVAGERFYPPAPLSFDAITAACARLAHDGPIPS